MDEISEPSQRTEEPNTDRMNNNNNNNSDISYECTENRVPDSEILFIKTDEENVPNRIDVEEFNCTDNGAMSEIMVAEMSLDCTNKQQLEYLCHFKRNQFHAEKVNLTMINKQIISMLKHMHADRNLFYRKFYFQFY